MSELKAQLAAYAAAVEALSPLTRTVFILYRVDDLPYGTIEARLSLDADTVMACIGHALTRVVQTVDGHKRTSPEPPAILEAQARLGREYTAYRARRALLQAINPPRLWQRASTFSLSPPWTDRVRGWLHGPTHPNKLPAIPPERTFDQWLRQRDGPLDLDEIWPVQRATS